MVGFWLKGERLADTRVRVLRLRSSSEIYGPERGFLELAPALAAAGVWTETVLLYRRPPGGGVHHPLVRAGAAAGLRITESTDRRWLVPLTAAAVARRLRAGRFDLLQTHGYKADLVGLPAARLAGVPAVAVLHGLDPGGSRTLGVYDRLDRATWSRFARLVAVSDEIRADALARGCDPCRVVTIHNALDVAVVQQRARAGPSAPLPGAAGARIAVVGRLAPEKDHATLLAAARIVVAERPDTTFLLAGDGPLRGELEARIRSLGLGERVHLLGYRDDAAAILAASAMLALPSRYEPCGRVLLESMALGLPIVATRVGGVPEIVEDGGTGVMVPPGDPDAFAAALLRLLADPALARELGGAGRRRIAARFEAGEAAARYAAVYREVLGAS